MTEHVTADLHVNHMNILKYCPVRRKHRELPPDDSPEYDQMVDEMNETIITNWNSKVDPGDTVNIVGDVAMGLIVKAPPLIRRLNGKKILITGNHDTSLIKLIKNNPEHTDLFEEIHKYKEIWYRYKGIKHLVCLFHFPMACWNSMSNGTIHFHGHTHGSPTGITGRTMDIGLDTNDLFPYSMDEVMERMLKIDVLRSHH